MALEAARAQHHDDSIQNLDKQCYCYQKIGHHEAQPISCFEAITKCSPNHV